MPMQVPNTSVFNACMPMSMKFGTIKHTCSSLIYIPIKKMRLLNLPSSATKLHLQSSDFADFSIPLPLLLVFVCTVLNYINGPLPSRSPQPRHHVIGNGRLPSCGSRYLPHHLINRTLRFNVPLLHFLLHGLLLYLLMQHIRLHKSIQITNLTLPTL